MHRPPPQRDKKEREKKRPGYFTFLCFCSTEFPKRSGEKKKESRLRFSILNYRARIDSNSRH